MSGMASKLNREDLEDHKNIVLECISSAIALALRPVGF